MEDELDNKLYCSQCDEWIIPVEGVTVIFARQRWWCAKHATIHHWENGKPIVDFPSTGMLVPRTIMKECA